jgi:hypothetical protein
MKTDYAAILKKMLPGKDLFAIFAKDLFLNGAQAWRPWGRVTSESPWKSLIQYRIWNSNVERPFF